ncbi:MAG: HAMP domain-containing sensor histidine kinase [Thermoanaerobaculia bacterium]
MRLRQKQRQKRPTTDAMDDRRTSRSFDPSLSGLLRNPGFSLRRYLILPFLLIALALGALAYRSYQLAVRMEKGLDEFAVQYLAYVAETTARRTDAIIQSELTRSADEWQQIERMIDEPTFGSLQRWINRNPWIVSAIFVPDIEPENSIFVSSINEPASRKNDLLTNEFYTATGTMKYTYDPALLLETTGPTLKTEPVVATPHLPEARDIRKYTHTRVVPTGASAGGLVQGAPEGLAVVVPLAAPMSRYAVRSSVEISVISAAWRNHRAVSIWLAAVAVGAFALGAMLALFGLRRQAEANRLRAALIANVSHELRTPLSMIRLGAETLKRGQKKLSPEQRTTIEDSILREAMHLSHLVENVLDVTRLARSSKPLVFAPVKPDELVESLISTYEGWIRSRGFTVETKIDALVPEQMWDRESISRALLNLIDNAMKYSADTRVVEVSLRQHDDAVVVAVRDHGIGIDEREIERIFEPYYRARFSDTETRRGAGIGLTLVRQIIEAHGGAIEVDSRPGEGSTFRMVFPMRKEIVGNAVPEVLNPSEAS